RNGGGMVWQAGLPPGLHMAPASRILSRVPISAEEGLGTHRRLTELVDTERTVNRVALAVISITLSARTCAADTAFFINSHKIYAARQNSSGHTGRTLIICGTCLVSTTLTTIVGDPNRRRRGLVVRDLLR